MKKLLLKSVILLVMVCFSAVVIGKGGGSSGNNKKFSATVSDFSFNFNSATTGTFSCKIKANGSVSDFDVGSGEFSTTKIDSDVTHVFTASESQSGSKYLYTRSNMILNIKSFQMESMYFYVVVYDTKTGEISYSREVTANGKVDGVEFTGTKMTIKGSF